MVADTRTSPVPVAVSWLTRRSLNRNEQAAYRRVVARLESPKHNWRFGAAQETEIEFTRERSARPAMLRSAALTLIHVN